MYVIIANSEFDFAIFLDCPSVERFKGEQTKGPRTIITINMIIFQCFSKSSFYGLKLESYRYLYPQMSVKILIVCKV